MLKLSAIIGPTAVGKTELSLQIAKELGAEIISCDSMQVYRGMDIGTAKASREEQAMVKHHLLDIVNPDEDFTVADYQATVKTIISKLNRQSVLPLLVGGTGLYYQAIVDDYTFYPMERKQEIRDKWRSIINENGLNYAYDYLKKIDLDYSYVISPHDEKRIIRALEVYELTGKPFSTLQLKNPNTYNLSSIGIYLDRVKLYDRINSRVILMLENGFIEEVIRLRNNNYDLECKSMQGLGYLQVINYLEGFLTKEQMIYEIQKETRRFAKRQYTWFKKDKRIIWFNVEDYMNHTVLAKKIIKHIKGQFSIV